jgi:copper oxidase (laccase) domain-containing protein
LQRHDVIPKRQKKKTTSIKKLLDTKNNFSEVTEYKINLKKLVAFQNTNNKQTEKEYRKTAPFIIASKNQVHKNILQKVSERPLQ